MSTKIISSLAALSEVYKQNNVELTEAPVVPQLSSYINIDVNTSLFVTKFSKEDVDDFYEMLARYPARNYHEQLEQILENQLASWTRMHQGKCPYEPFLWALKLTDNYFGSIANGANEPDKTMLEPIANALRKLYKNEYAPIIKNVLLNWEWYQPVHVALKMYESIDEYDDEAINEKIREYWLLHFMYTHNAYRCLLQKKMTDKNMQTVLFHACYEKRNGVNGTDITITKKDRIAFLSMYRRQPEECKSSIRTAYTDRRQSCARNVREDLDAELMRMPATPVNHDPKILEIMRSYSRAKNDYERDSALFEFNISLDEMLERRDRNEEKTLKEVVSQAPRYGLAGSVADVFFARNFDFSSQFRILMMLGVENGEYSTDIEKHYRDTCRSGICTEDGMMFACVYCLLGHSELVDSIVYAYYMDGLGLTNVKYIFAKVGTNYSQQVKSAVNDIVNECKNDLEKSRKVVANCAKVYNKEKDSTLFPVAFDALCAALIDAAITNSSNGFAYAKVVIDLLGKIATTNNRQRYYDMLIKLYKSEAGHLKGIRRSTNDLVRKLYPVT